MGAVFRLNMDSMQPSAGTKLIKADEYARFIEADRIIEAAREKAAQMEEASQKAYEERKQAGYQDGLEEGKLEHSEKLLETILSSVEFIEGIESTLVNVVNQSIRKIIGDLDDDERIVRIVRNALEIVRGQQRVTVRVAPVNERTILDALAAMTSNASGNAFLTVVADARLEPDSCILESELGVVDASLTTQLKALENAFNSKIHQ